MVNGVDHATRAVGRPERSLGSPPRAVPEMDVAALLFGEASHDVTVQIGTHRAGEHERLVIGEDRRPEGVPRQHKKRGGRIEIGISLEMCQLLQAPTLDLAPGCVESVFRRRGVRIPLLFEQDLLAPAALFLRNLARLAALQRPVTREFLERRTEGGEIEIDPGDAGVLEGLDPVPDGLCDPGFNVLPIKISFGSRIVLAGTADQEDGAFGRRLVLDVQAALGLGVDRP